MTCEQANTTPTAHGTLETILKDPSASFWLKTSLQTALERDAIDAANDAERLAELLRQRAETYLCPMVPTNICGKGQSRMSTP